MPAATTPRETPIPPPPLPDTAEPARAPEPGANALAAMRGLLWLMMYLTIMRLFGYRIARSPSHRAARPTPSPAPAPTPAAPKPPRQKHRTLNPANCLALLARINAAFAPAISELAHVEPAPSVTADRRHATRPLARPHPPRCPTAPPAAASILSPRLTPRQQAPPRQKPLFHPTSPHVDFVTTPE